MPGGFNFDDAVAIDVPGSFAGSSLVCAMSRCSIFSGCKSHPASGSLQPVAIEATQGGNELVGAFETNVSHLAMQRTDRP
jgi:hypothetical protein